MKSNDNDMLVDESKLSASEVERLAWIKKLSTEADEIVRSAGFPTEETEESFKEIVDTDWSGQSGAERMITSSNNWSDLANRWQLVIGDTLALILFAAIGRSNHAEDGSLFDAIQTAAPFILGWLATAPFLGAFSGNATATKNGVFLSILPAWAVSIPVGLGLRSVLKGAVPPTPFIVVSMVATYILLAVWRYGYVFLFGETADTEYRSAGVFEVFKMVSTLLKRW